MSSPHDIFPTHHHISSFYHHQHLILSYHSIILSSEPDGVESAVARPSFERANNPIVGQGGGRERNHGRKDFLSSSLAAFSYISVLGGWVGVGEKGGKNIF